MTTPPKAPCHSCNGTGIDPTVGFLDCEFCTPAFAGVSLSAPEQPEPKCTMCNDHGEIGCLRPDGYDGERCPDCNPATVKRYHVTETGLVEGAALGRINVVLAADYDVAVAVGTAFGNTLERVVAERDALQQLLTAADERADAMEGLLRTSLIAMKRIYQAGYDRIIAAGGTCDTPEYMMESDPTVREIRAALKPAEGGGDEAMSFEQIAQFNDDHDGRPERDD